MALTREQILAARKDRKPTRLEVPEWGGDVYVRVLTVDEQLAMSDGLGPAEATMMMILDCIVDEKGARIFTDDDREWLGQEPGPTILRIAGEVAKVNGLTQAELQDAMESFGKAPAKS